MQNQIASSPDLQLLHEPTWCAAASCNATAAIDFAGRALCFEHFLPACIAEIESRNERLRNLPFDPSATGVSIMPPHKSFDAGIFGKP